MNKLKNKKQILNNTNNKQINRYKFLVINL